MLQSLAALQLFQIILDLWYVNTGSTQGISISGGRGRTPEKRHINESMVGGERDFLDGFLNDSYITKQHTWFSYLKIKFISLK